MRGGNLVNRRGCVDLTYGLPYTRARSCPPLPGSPLAFRTRLSSGHPSRSPPAWLPATGSPACTPVPGFPVGPRPVLHRGPPSRAAPWPRAQGYPVAPRPGVRPGPPSRTPPLGCPSWAPPCPLVPSSPAWPPGSCSPVAPVPGSPVSPRPGLPRPVLRPGLPRSLLFRRPPLALVPAYTPLYPVPGSPVLPRGLPRALPSRLHPCPHPALQQVSSPAPRALRLHHLTLVLPVVGRAGGGRTGAISHPMCSPMASYSRVRNVRDTSRALKVQTCGGGPFWKLRCVNFRAASLAVRVP